MKKQALIDAIFHTVAFIVWVMILVIADQKGDPVGGFLSVFPIVVFVGIAVYRWVQVWRYHVSDLRED